MFSILKISVQNIFPFTYTFNGHTDPFSVQKYTVPNGKIPATRIPFTTPLISLYLVDISNGKKFPFQTFSTSFRSWRILLYVNPQKTNHKRHLHCNGVFTLCTVFLSSKIWKRLKRKYIIRNTNEKKIEKPVTASALPFLASNIYVYIYLTSHADLSRIGRRAKIARRRRGRRSIGGVFCGPRRKRVIKTGPPPAKGFQTTTTTTVDGYTAPLSCRDHE